MSTTALLAECLNAESWPLCVESIDDFDSFMNAKPAWDRLVEKCDIAHPFLTHDWIHTWWESFGAGRELRIVTVREGGALIAIAPLMISRTRIYGIPVRELGSISNDHTPRFDFIAAGPFDNRASVVDAIWNHLWEMKNEWDVMKLCQFDTASPALDQLCQLAGTRSCWFATWDSTASPYLPVSGAFDDKFATLPRGQRANIRRRMKRLEEIGPVEFEQVSDESKIDEALADAFRMEAGTWKGEEGTAIACDQEVTRFYSDIARRAARQGTLYFTFLLLNGRRIAFDLSMIYNQRLFKLKPGYLQEYHASSPGQQLTVMTIRDAYTRGLSEVDFLGSADEWKLAWTKDIRQHQWAYVFKKNLLGSFLYYAKFHLAPWIRAYRARRAEALTQEVKGA